MGDHKKTKQDQTTIHPTWYLQIYKSIYKQQMDFVYSMLCKHENQVCVFSKLILTMYTVYDERSAGKQFNDIDI